MNVMLVRSAMGVAIALALGAGPVMAKATYCMDPTTHKRISCKTAPAANTAPAGKTGQAAVPAGPVPAAAAPTGPHKGKKCGKSYIAADKTCHKTGG